MNEFSPYCIYTIRHSKDLRFAFQNGRQGKFKEMTNWKSGKELLIQARKYNTVLPIIFAAAELTTNLIYWARVINIQTKQTNNRFETTYEFDMITKIKENPSKTTLRLKSTGQHLSENHIRPYAICYTPDYLK